MALFPPPCDHTCLMTRQKPERPRKGDWLTPFLERLITSAFLVFAGPALAQEPPPTRAYPVRSKDYVPPADDGTVRHVPGSTKGYTLTDIRDLFFALDWFPESHAPMPPIVARGSRPNRRPCGTCHRPEGVRRSRKRQPRRSPVRIPSSPDRQLPDRGPHDGGQGESARLSHDIGDQRVNRGRDQASRRILLRYEASNSSEGGRKRSRPDYLRSELVLRVQAGRKNRAARRPHYRDSRQ